MILMLLFRYGWMVFANEDMASKNYEKLQNKQFAGRQIFVDFCGEKSKSKSPTKEGNERGSRNEIKNENE